MNIKRSTCLILKYLFTGLLLNVILFSEIALAAGRFEATGLTVPRRIASSRGLRTVAVTVKFDLLPTRMEFELPSFPTLFTENGYRYCNNYTETYDPEALIGDDGHQWHLSFEVMQDRENRYARIWIDTQSDARIVVREMGALCDKHYTIPHTDIPSGSPYGEGDWADEWYYIYPDGAHVRHVRIYTGLAMDAYPFGFDRRAPDAIYEFQESYPMRERDRLREEFLDINALTLIKMNGESKTISYVPYPQNFGEFMNANIQVVNFHSQYKPFTIARPDGITIQPLQVGELSEGRVFGYALGHILNYKFYKRTVNTLEQVYLQGWSHAPDPVAELVPLAKSWLQAPELQLNTRISSRYTNKGYDLTQRAYILLNKRKDRPSTLEFELSAGSDSPLFNPAFLIKNWGKQKASLRIDGQIVECGDAFRQGFEDDTQNSNLIVWIKKETNRPVTISLSPVEE